MVRVNPTAITVWHQRYILRDNWHGTTACPACWVIGTKVKWNSVWWGKKIFCTGPTRPAKAGPKSLEPSRQAKRTNQEMTDFICTPWVPICLSFNSQHGPPLSIVFLCDTLATVLDKIMKVWSLDFPLQVYCLSTWLYLFLIWGRMWRYQGRTGLSLPGKGIVSRDRRKPSTRTFFWISSNERLSLPNERRERWKVSDRIFLEIVILSNKQQKSLRQKFSQS